MSRTRRAVLCATAAALLASLAAPPVSAAPAGPEERTAASDAVPTDGSVSFVDDTVSAYLDGNAEVIVLSAGLFQARTRIVVLANGRYLGETYAGSAYYAGRWSVGDRVLIRVGTVEPGDHLEVSVVAGVPGDSLGSAYGRYPLLEEQVRPAAS